MEVEITPELVNEIKKFIASSDFVNCMNDYGLSVQAMMVVLQQFMECVNQMNDVLDEVEKM